MGGPGNNNPTGPINMLPVRLHAPAPDPTVSQRSLSVQPSDGARPGGRVGFGGFQRSGGTEPGATASPLNSRGGVARLSSSMGHGGPQPSTPGGAGAGGWGGAGGGLPGAAGGGFYGEASLALIPEDSSVVGGGGAGSALAGNPSSLSLEEAGAGEGEGEGPVPGTPPSLRIVDMRQFMPHADMDETSGGWRCG